MRSEFPLLLTLLLCLATSTGGSMPIFNPSLLQSNPIQSVILPPVSPPRTVTPLAPSTGERTLLAISRRQSEVIPPHLATDREPTCAELRAMWRHMRRMSRQMEMTNEIPRVPNPFVSYSYRPSKYPDANPYSPKMSSINSKVFQKSDGYDPGLLSFGKIVQDPVDINRYYKTKGRPSTNPSRGRPVHVGFDDFDDDTRYISKGHGRVSNIPGRFSNIPLPEESLGVFGTVVHSPEEKARYRARVRQPPGISYRNRWNNKNPSYRAGKFPTSQNNKYPYGSVVSMSPDERQMGHPVGMYHPRGGFAEYPSEVGQRTNSPTRVERVDKYPGKFQSVCLRLQSKICKTDSDCSCNGSPKLICAANRCQPRSKALKYTSPSKWHKSYYADPYEGNLIDYEGNSMVKHDPFWTTSY